jgi:hypothetical protein
MRNKNKKVRSIKVNRIANVHPHDMKKETYYPLELE